MMSIKPKSIFRKFSIIFVGVSLIPLIVLYYLYSLYDESHRFIQIWDAHFSLIIVIIGVISILGFFGMRKTIKKIAILTETVNKQAILKSDQKVILELADEEGELGELARSFIRNLKRVEKREQKPEETKQIISDVLKKVSEVLAVVNNYDNLIHLVLETTADALGAKQGALFSADDGRYTVKAWAGMYDVRAEQVMDAAQTYLDEVAVRNRSFLITAEESEQSDILFIPPLLFSPLVYNEKFLGALCFCGNRYWSQFPNTHLAVVSNLSHQLAVSFENAKINKDSDQTYFETLAALALAVEARDPYSRGHSGRVGKTAQKIGERLGFSGEEIKALGDASMLHDIGKIGIRYGLFIKQGKISVEEKYVIRNHTVIGESIVFHLPTYKHLLDPIRHHHEQLDGSGYPDGLENREISRITHVLTIADLFDTLMEDRPYRSGMNFKDALKELDNLVIAGKMDKDVISGLYHMY